MPVKPEIAPVAAISPLLATVNLVTPAADAVRMSPLLVWLIIAAALPPMPPETESGAGVLALDPIRTPDW